MDRKNAHSIVSRFWIVWYRLETLWRMVSCLLHNSSRMTILAMDPWWFWLTSALIQVWLREDPRTNHLIRCNPIKSELHMHTYVICKWYYAWCFFHLRKLAKVRLVSLLIHDLLHSMLALGRLCGHCGLCCPKYGCTSFNWYYWNKSIFLQLRFIDFLFMTGFLKFFLLFSNTFMV